MGIRYVKPVIYHSDNQRMRASAYSGTLSIGRRYHLQSGGYAASSQACFSVIILGNFNFIKK